MDVDRPVLQAAWLADLEPPVSGRAPNARRSIATAPGCLPSRTKLCTNGKKGAGQRGANRPRLFTAANGTPHPLTSQDNPRFRRKIDTPWDRINIPHHLTVRPVAEDGEPVLDADGNTAQLDVGLETGHFPGARAGTVFSVPNGCTPGGAPNPALCLLMACPPQRTAQEPTLRSTWLRDRAQLLRGRWRARAEGRPGPLAALSGIGRSILIRGAEEWFREIRSAPLIRPEFDGNVHLLRTTSGEARPPSWVSPVARRCTVP